MIEKYNFIRTIQENGENADVFLIEDKLGQKFILKKFNKAVKSHIPYGKVNHFGRRREGNELVFNEIKNVSENFSFLINFYERFKWENKWCIVIEYFNGITFNRFLNLNKNNENKNFKPLNTMREDATPHSNSASRSLSFSSYEHSIESNSYRYEPWTSGKSEFAVTAIRIDPSGTFHLIYQTNSGTFKTWQKISEIKKNDIGSTRYVWAHHASNWEPWSNPWTEATQNGVNMVFWNTFERDWNRSSKQIGTCSASGTTIYLAGNMRFSSEWYSWIPSTANIHFTRFEWIYNDWAHWNSSWKAKFRLWRV